jgi:hypothetical protein
MTNEIAKLIGTVTTVFIPLFVGTLTFLVGKVDSGELQLLSVFIAVCVLCEVASLYCSLEALNHPDSNEAKDDIKWSKRFLWVGLLIYVALFLGIIFFTASAFAPIRGS